MSGNGESSGTAKTLAAAHLDSDDRRIEQLIKKILKTYNKRDRNRILTEFFSPAQINDRQCKAILQGVIRAFLEAAFEQGKPREKFGAELIEAVRFFFGLARSEKMIINIIDDLIFEQVDEYVKSRETKYVQYYFNKMVASFHFLAKFYNGQERFVCQSTGDDKSQKNSFTRLNAREDFLAQHQIHFENEWKKIVLSSTLLDEAFKVDLPEATDEEIHRRPLASPKSQLSRYGVGRALNFVSSLFQSGAAGPEGIILEQPPTELARSQAPQVADRPLEELYRNLERELKEMKGDMKETKEGVKRANDSIEETKKILVKMGKPTKWGVAITALTFLVAIGEIVVASKEGDENGWKDIDYIKLFLSIGVALGAGIALLLESIDLVKEYGPSISNCLSGNHSALNNSNVSNAGNSTSATNPEPSESDAEIVVDVDAQGSDDSNSNVNSDLGKEEVDDPNASGCATPH